MPAVCPWISSFRESTLSVIAGLDPAIHTMTLPPARRGDFALSPLQPRPLV
jgi:hypothetical protein